MEEDEVPELIDSLAINDNQTAKDETKDSVRIPLTLITGFLGAGKSTLLQHILTERHGYRIAVIMNEFGDTADIEGRAISVSDAASDDTGKESALSSDVLELANGCLCCSIKDTGVAAIEKLMMKKGAFDYIILETTGLADPGPIAAIFWQNEEFPSPLGKDIYLDSIICVVDSVFGLKQLDEDHSTSGIGESLRQIASADIIILNKADVASEETLSKLQARVKAVNPHVPMYQTTRGAIEVGKIIDLDAFRSRASLLSSDLPQDQESHDHIHDHSEDDHTHTEYFHQIQPLQISLPHLSEDQHVKLDEWIRTVLWESELPCLSGESGTKGNSESLEVLRTKGIFNTPSGSFVLQGVRELYEISPLPSESEGNGPEPINGKLVLIGKGLGSNVKVNFTSYVGL